MKGYITMINKKIDRFKALQKLLGPVAIAKRSCNLARFKCKTSQTAAECLNI